MLDEFGEDDGGFLHAQAQAFAHVVDEVDLLLADLLVGENDADHVFKEARLQARVDFKDVIDGVLEESTHITLGDLVQEELGEDVAAGEVTDDVLNLLAGDLLVDAGGDQAGRGDEDGQGLVQRAVAHLEENLDQLLHALVQRILVLGIGKQVDGLDTDRIDRMVVLTHTLSLEEILQPLAVVLQEIVDADLHLLEIQTGGHLEESRHAGLQFTAGEIAIAVRHQLGEVVVQVDLILQQERDPGLGRIDEIDQPPQGRVLVDEVSQLMADDEAQFVLAHQVEEFGIDIDDMRMPPFLRRDGEGVDGGIPRHVEIDGLLEAQPFLDVVAKIVEVPEEILFHFHAVALHAASPVIVVRGVLRILEDELHDIALQGRINLGGKFLLEFEFGV